MPIKKDKKKSKTIVVKKTSKKGKLSQSQSITVNIQKGKSTAKQPSGRPTIASSITSLSNVIRASDFYRPIPSPVAPVGAVPAPIKASPVKQSIAIQSEPEVALRLGSGRFNLPPRKPVNLKLPPQNFPARPDIQEEEEKFQRLIKEKTEYFKSLKEPEEGEKPFIQPVIRTIKKRRNQQEMDEARQMGREDIASIQLGLSRFNNPERSDSISEISTTPLYEGGREVQESKPKRSYIKSGRYSKKKLEKPTTMTESEGEFDSPVKPPRASYSFEYAEQTY